jgi:hypothetical protein
MADPFSQAKHRLLDRAMRDGRLTPASRLVFYEIIQHVNRVYRIKSVQEPFERTVLECDLSPSIIPEEQYEPMRPLRRAGGHH